MAIILTTLIRHLSTYTNFARTQTPNHTYVQVRRNLLPGELHRPPFSQQHLNRPRGSERPGRDVGVPRPVPTQGQGRAAAVHRPHVPRAHVRRQGGARIRRKLIPSRSGWGYTFFAGCLVCVFCCVRILRSNASSINPPLTPVARMPHRYGSRRKVAYHIGLVVNTSSPDAGFGYGSSDGGDRGSSLRQVGNSTFLSLSRGVLDTGLYVKIDIGVGVSTSTSVSLSCLFATYLCAHVPALSFCLASLATPVRPLIERTQPYH